MLRNRSGLDLLQQVENNYVCSARILDAKQRKD